MSQIELTFSAQGGALSGDLTRHTVPKLAGNSVKELLKNENTVLDLAGVVTVDTAGLAWLLALIEEAEQSHQKLGFSHLPEDLLKLAKLSSVDHFLPLI